MTPGRLDGVSHPVTLVARDPDLARQCAEQVLSGDCDAATRSAALRMLAAASRESGQDAAAERLLRQSAAVAARVGDGERAAHARASRLGLLALRGSGGMAAESLARLSAAAASARAVLLTHQGVAAAQRGRFGAAVAGFDSALAALDRETDRHLLPGVLSNRGLALMYEGRSEESAADLADALRHADEHGQSCLRGVTLQNLGCLAVRRGDIAHAVSCFAAAEHLVPPQRRPGVRLDHADALLAAGMHREAERLLGGLAVHAGSGRDSAEAATAGLLHAKMRLARGDAQGARDLARRLRRAFAADSLWTELARLVEWSARHSAFPPPRSTGSRSARSGSVAGAGRRAAECAAIAAPIGADAAAAGARARPAVSASEVPRPRQGGEHVGEPTPPAPAAPVDADWSATPETTTALAHCVHAAPLGPLSAVLPSAHEAAALRALAAGDHGSARDRLLSRPEHTTPARHLELMAHARARRREMAAAGARLALRAGDAAAALEWAEFASLSTVPSGPCHDREWSALLDRCRRAHVRAHGGDPAARQELSAIADRLSAAQWHPECMAAEDVGGPEHPVAATLAERLGERALVRYLRVHGRDAAITLAGGRMRVHPLPPPGDTEDAVAKLAYAARARVFAEEGGRFRRDGVAAAAAAVERLLVGPVREAVGDRSLVVVPPPSAQALPWGLLPSMRGREISVVPSGRSWLACRERGEGRAERGAGARVLLAAGAAPAGAAAEVDALRAALPRARVLCGPRVCVDDVLGGLEEADIAHLAAHGSASWQAPMLAGVLLEDGPLFAYDVERLARAPRVTVLSSCWVGGSVPAASGAPLGMAASLLAVGGGAVVAGVLPVSDRGITPAMLAFHTALHAGATPAGAVAEHLADAGFICYGAG
ncbi:CHAT domain-containing protein [Streptomonospora litoralis]|uniref:CHAT domain protein n=1 Tax=Streptomonospora litoralis TaxID=2498135 RepID=A0A4V0ZJZ9_9ACTN|nr:CHAT domain-containing protein [Streptomonospora litoralis]QBI55242.1 CHAT domain protein [Streptomonospora litoralis]